MHKKHSTTVTGTVVGKLCIVNASDQKSSRWQVNNASYTRPTITDTVAGKQCMVYASDRKFPGKQACFDQSIATDRYSARRCLQSEIRMTNGKHKRVIPTSSIVNGQTWSKIAALHFQLWKHHFSESYNRVKCNYILQSGKWFGRNTTRMYYHSLVDILVPAWTEG